MKCKCKCNPNFISFRLNSSPFVAIKVRRLRLSPLTVILMSRVQVQLTSSLPNGSLPLLHTWDTFKVYAITPSTQAHYGSFGLRLSVQIGPFTRLEPTSLSLSLSLLQRTRHADAGNVSSDFVAEVENFLLPIVWGEIFYFYIWLEEIKSIVSWQ